MGGGVPYAFPDAVLDAILEGNTATTTMKKTDPDGEEGDKEETPSPPLRSVDRSDIYNSEEAQQQQQKQRRRGEERRGRTMTAINSPYPSCLSETLLVRNNAMKVLACAYEDERLG